jgi:hypothetical protein
MKRIISSTVLGTVAALALSAMPASARFNGSNFTGVGSFPPVAIPKPFLVIPKPFLAIPKPFLVIPKPVFNNSNFTGGNNSHGHKMAGRGKSFGRSSSYGAW